MKKEWKLTEQYGRDMHSGKFNEAICPLPKETTHEAKDEEAKREMENKYLVWKKEQGWTEETKDDYFTDHTPAGIELWKRVGIFTL